MIKDAYPQILHYHQRTKHHFQRYARSLGYMDWPNQPAPFRFYEGVTCFSLPPLEQDPPGTQLALYNRSDLPPRPFDLASIAGFLELSLGLSAWKEYGGTRWALRINPSSGNLHPTEAHLVLPPLDELPSGVYHYSPYLHALEQRACIPGSTWDGFVQHFGSSGFLIGLTSILWREAWKYGERAYRYTQLDLGHALACISFAGGLFGWVVTFLDTLSTEQVETVLGLDRVQWPGLGVEHAGPLCWVSPLSPSAVNLPSGLPESLLDLCASLEFTGIPNRLSPDHIKWDLVYEVAQAARKPVTPPVLGEYQPLPALDAANSPLPAARLIRRRRSAQSYSRERSFLSLPALLAILDKTRPRSGTAPFDLYPDTPDLHLLIFVHNVSELKPGLYLFLRPESRLQELKSLTRPDYRWQAVNSELPLYQLQAGDFRDTATRLSCQQEIAGESAFSLGMLARFEDTLQPAPYRYPHLYWQAGMLGQVLYLEAEALDLGGTGIGCFFDEGVHELLGFHSYQYQDLYHFTLGAPVPGTP